MTKQTGTIDVSSFTTDAKFRTWGSTCATALSACGLVQTSDTGQINWTTVTKPTATGTKAGYEIYRFSDTLQATKPVFLKVEYGSQGVASGNSAATWLTVGTGSNGSGTLTGITLGPFQSYNGSTAMNNTASPYWFTHTANGYCLMNFGQALATGSQEINAGFWIVGRTVHPTTGVATGDGLVMLKLTVGPFHVQYGLDFNTNTAYGTASEPNAGAISTTTRASGSSIPLGLTYHYTSALYPFSGTLNYNTADITGMTTFTSSPFGMSHTYLAWSAAYSPRGFHFLSSSNIFNTVALATIWED